MEGTNRVTNVYYAVRNDDGSFGELHCLGETVDDIEMILGVPAEDLENEVKRFKEVLCETFEAEICIGYADWERIADAFGLFVGETQTAIKSLDEFARSIPYDPPKRAGFRPHRRSWESDKDDPSTFGAYINGKRKKKKRR